MTDLSNSQPARVPKLRRLWLWYRRHRHRVDGAVIVAAGVALLVWTGVLSASTTHPPSTPELTVLLAGAAVLQIWGGVSFGRVGHVDAEKAKSAVRRLFAMGLTVQALQTYLRESLEIDKERRYRDSVIRADEAMNAVGYHLTYSIADWTDVHPEALQETMDRLARERQQLLREGGGEE